MEKAAVISTVKVEVDHTTFQGMKGNHITAKESLLAERVPEQVS